MSAQPSRRPTPEMSRLSSEEEKSLTHGEFWIPEDERVVFQEAIRALNRAGVPYVVSGLYAIYAYTGIYRKTKDLDLLFLPGSVVEAATVLKESGFRVELENVHWLAKAWKGDVLVDLVFGMANGLHLIDDQWLRHSRPGILAAEPVRVAPPEELILHRLFISERHRSDVADVAHLIMARGGELNWDRLLERVGDHWRLLLAQIHIFDYVYPGRRSRVPTWVRAELYERALEEIETQAEDPDTFRGTLVSRFSFAIDVNEWGFRDLRTEAITGTRMLPVIRQIGAAEVWDAASDPADMDRGVAGAEDEPEPTAAPTGRGRGTAAGSDPHASGVRRRGRAARDLAGRGEPGE